ncbi:MAG: DUF4296 domain-containing protein [Bacteroidota bacterium]
MRIGLISVIAVLLMAAACAPKEKPPIPKAKFEEMIVDLSLNEGTFSRLYDVDTNVNRIVSVQNLQVLQKHKVSKADFIKTFRYYDSRKPELLEIYKSALAKTEKRRDALQKAVDKKKKEAEKALKEKEKTQAVKDTAS